MHPEDRYILTHLLSNVNITNDIYFACEQGFIKTKQLEEIVNNPDYEGSLIEIFKNWYNEEATPEQQMLVDINGFVHLNDQFDDLDSIISVEIDNYLSKEKKENDLPLSLMEELVQITKPNNKNIRKMVSENKFPLRTFSDIDNNANMVYILNYSGRDNWRELVQSLFFRMKNNHYNGIDLKTSFDWFKNYIYIQNRERKQALMNIYESETEYSEENKDNKEELSFIAKKMKLGKNKELSYAKKAIKRGLKTLESFVGSNDVRLFNSGDGFIVEAKLFNYRFRKSHTSIIKHTMNPLSIHVPYDIIVMTKENLELANLCVYFDETPLIDQLISTVLHLKSGNEEEVLRTGNFFNKKDSFYHNPIINKMFKSDAERYAEDLSEYTEMVNNIVGNMENLIETSDELRESRYYKIKEALFKALPTYLGMELPTYVYRDFSNLTFDQMFERYNLDEEMPFELQTALENF